MTTAEKLAALTEDHARVVDLVAIAMRALDGVTRPDDMDQMTDLTRRLYQHNTPVVYFLVKVVADLAVALADREDVSHEAVVEAMRIYAADYLNMGEALLRSRGIAT